MGLWNPPEHRRHRVGPCDAELAVAVGDEQRTYRCNRISGHRGAHATGLRPSMTWWG